MKQCLSTLDNRQSNIVISDREKQRELYNCPRLRSERIFQAIAQGMKPKESPEFSIHWRDRDQSSGRSRQLNLQDRSQPHRGGESSRDMQKALLNFLAGYRSAHVWEKLLTHSLGQNHQEAAN